jgi:hypothetical protein
MRNVSLVPFLHWGHHGLEYLGVLHFVQGLLIRSGPGSSPCARALCTSKQNDLQCLSHDRLCGIVSVPGYRTEMYCVSCEVRTEFICYVEESRPPLWSSGQISWLQNGDVLRFLCGTNWIYICYVEESRPPLWSSGQISWLQIQRSGFDSRRYQIFWDAVGLERGQFSLVSPIEELLERKVAAPV